MIKRKPGHGQTICAESYMIKDKSIVITNIYYMLSYAYHSLRHENYEEIKTEAFDNVQDLFAAILAKGIAAQLKHGLSRAYIEKKDNLSTLRGKIDLKASLQLMLRDERRLVCCYDELSENHYMNQILKSTALCLILDSNVQRKNKAALKSAISFFSEVDTLKPSGVDWRRIHYNRNNTSYRMLMNICYLVLHGLLLTTEDGKQQLATFLDDQQMSRLYEKFILEYYEKHFPQHNPAPKEIKWNTDGTIDFLPKMRSDIMLTNDRRKLIIDAKYYGKIMQERYDAETIQSHNLYQIFAYVKNEDKNNTGLVDGMLLYAKTDESFAPDVTYNLCGNRISIKTLDLGQNFEGIKKQLNDVANKWFAGF